MVENIENLPERIFVTGTDTGVGKTLVCAALMSVFDNAFYWKPIQTGSEEGTDTEWIKRVTGLPNERFIPEAYCFKKPLSPHEAASLENATIDLHSIELPNVSGRLIVEGAGGVMVPINDRYFILDLIKHLGLPALVVSRSTLGTINHSLLTLMALRNAGIDIVGVIMNGPRNESNKKSIEYYGKTFVIAQIEPISVVNVENIKRAIISG